MQTHSIILWMKKEDFLLIKRFVAVFWKEYGPFVMLRKVGPCSGMDALVRAEGLYHSLNWE